VKRPKSGRFLIFNPMQTFLNDILDKFIDKNIDQLAKTTFILPGKRAGGFLKRLIRSKTDYTGFAPEILSIEEFITQITGLRMLDNTNSLFRFYQIYKQQTPQNEQESFDTFYAWAQTLIHDFNEIDRYLIDPERFFNYLSEIQQVEHWSLASPQTDLVKNYLKFWSQLANFHQDFVSGLLENKEAYQGLIYRKAADTIQDFLKSSDNQFIFIGFNALNNAEQKMIQEVLIQKKGEVYWDIDRHFIEAEYHDAGLFMRHYLNNWPYYKTEENQFNWLSDFYNQPKTIQTIGVPKNIGQAKYVGSLLKTVDQKNTAVVLNDEGLLLPVLNSLPDEVQTANVTMGLPLALTPPASLFEVLFKIQLDNQGNIYHKNVLEVLSHPSLKIVESHLSEKIQAAIIKNNHVFISREDIIAIAGEQNADLLDLCFTIYDDKAEPFLKALLNICQHLRPEDLDKHAVETEYLFHFNKLFNKLLNLLAQYEPVESIQALYQIYKDSLNNESIDFGGSPHEGLQIMGMLETRVLDYETVILTSVNEGVLPTGKSTNSFIPYELKKRYGLPTYKEKDAVYAYHFYRLLQRAKNVYLLYNTEASSLNTGEKSRFLTQLEVERPQSHTFIQGLVNSKISTNPTGLQEIEKTPEMLEILKKQAKSGFSPSALTSYIWDPLTFYKNYVLGIRENEEIEEEIASNTLGTAIHDTLEKFYKPLIGKNLLAEDLKKMRAQIDSELKHQFEKEQNAHIDHGKNLIIFEVAKRYLNNFLDFEERQLKNGDLLKTLHIENDEIKRKLPIPELDFEVYLRGKVDRVDQLNDTIRVVDYKTGNAKPSELNIKSWDDLIEEPKHIKAFQVLSYASLLMHGKKYNQIEAGILSLKSLSSGFIPFSDHSEKKGVRQIDSNVLHLFHEQLNRLILKIFNPTIPFKEKKKPDYGY